MFDFRYHAMSLAAVFVALALGLLLGLTLGDANLISDVRGNLEASLKNDLNDARRQAGERKDRIERQNEFIGVLYTQLVRGDLAGDRIAQLGSAGVAQSTLRSVGRAVGPADAEVSYVAQLSAKPEYKKIAAALGISRLIKRDQPTATEAERLGRAVGRRLAGGRNTAVMRRFVFSRLSGSYQRSRLFVYARQQQADFESPAGEAFDGFERGVVSGLAEPADRVAGVESTTTSPSNIEWYNSLGLSTVDNIEDYAGYYALVAILGGAKGDFGTKQTAGSLVPEVGP